MNGPNKLECLFLIGLYSQVLCMQVMLEFTPVKHLSGAPLWGKHLAFLTNITLDWKSQPGKNTLAYLAYS
jgi:hypothetical protein